MEGVRMTDGAEMVDSELALSRARIYGILATVYSRPAGDAEFDMFRHWWSTEAELPEGSLPQIVRRGLRKVKTWIEVDGSQPSHERKSALESEFVRLFRGLRRGTSPPPPYESVYVDGGHLYGVLTDDVSRKYQQFNLKVQNNEPPDHLALELSFMRYLCKKEAEARSSNQAVRNWLEEQNEFLHKHLVQWLPIFCESIRKSCESRFYSGVADLTEGWILCDQEIIRDLIGKEGHS